MAANDDKLIISKELAEKLKINEKTLAEQIGNVISPAIVKQLEKLSQLTVDKPKEDPSTKPSLFSSSKLLSNIPSFVRGLFSRSSAQNEEEQESPEGQDSVKTESKPSPKSGLVEKLLSMLTSKPAEQTKPEQKSLLEKQEVIEKPVTVGNFSDSALEKLSAILPDAVTKGTQHIADSLEEILKKFDKLIDAVKDMSGEGGSGGGLLDDVMDFLPSRKGRARRGTLARKAKAKALRAKRSAGRKIKNIKTAAGAKVNTVLKKTGVDKILDKVRGKSSSPLQKAGSVADDVKPSALGKVASVADDVKPSALGKVASVADDVKPSALGKVASVADDVKPSALGKVASVADDVGTTSSKAIKAIPPTTAIEKVGGTASKMKNIGSGLGKVGGTALKGLGAAGAVVGAGYEFASRKEEGQTNTQATVGTAGTAAGGALGAWGGAAAGAAIGSVVPVVGTVIGGIAGGLIGGFGGAWLGGKGADKLTGAEDTVKQKAVIDEWKANIEAADPVLGKEYVTTYEKLPEDKKKEINTTLVVNWEGDRESAEDTVKKRLQEANPKLIYGDKIPAGMTETVDKAISTSQESKPTTPPVVAPSDDLAKRAGLIKKEDDTYTDKDGIHSYTKKDGMFFDEFGEDVTNDLSKEAKLYEQRDALKQAEVKPGASLGEAKAKQIQQNREKVKELVTTPSQQKEIPQSVKSVIDQPGKALDAPVSFGLEGMKPVQDEGLEPPEVSADPEYPLSPQSSAPALKSGPKAAASNVIKTLSTGTVAAVTPGVVAGVGASLVGNNLLEKNESKQKELAPGQQEAISPPAPRAELSSIASVKPESVSPSIAKTAAASEKDAGKSEGLLQTIAENTKKTNEQVGRLADAFSVFSKMLPGSIASMSSRSDSTPVVVSPKQSAPQGDKLRSTQIAKAGNAIIHNFRSALEGTRQLPA
jgi:hypothetical protein